MNSLHDQFTLTPEILKGMSRTIPSMVQDVVSGDTPARANYGVEACIAAAILDASTNQDGRAGDVLAHLKYQRDQLSILIANLESLTE